jgi:hypothetical protein
LTRAAPCRVSVGVQVGTIVNETDVDGPLLNHADRNLPSRMTDHFNDDYSGSALIGIGLEDETPDEGLPAGVSRCLTPLIHLRRSLRTAISYRTTMGYGQSLAPSGRCLTLFHASDTLETVPCVQRARDTSQALASGVIVGSLPGRGRSSSAANGP